MNGRAEALSSIEGKPAKAQLREYHGTRLRDVAAEALRRSTSQKAAAADMRLNEGRLSHKLRDGSLTLKQLETLGAEFGRELGDICRQTYGNADPQERKRRVISELRNAVDQLAEVI